MLLRRFKLDDRRGTFNSTLLKFNADTLVHPDMNNNAAVGTVGLHPHHTQPGPVKCREC